VRIEITTDDGDRWIALDETAPHAGAPDPVDDFSAGADQLIVIGAGLGYLLDAIERRGRPMVVVLEPDRAVATLLLARRDWSAWLAAGRLKLLVGPDYLGAAGAARCFDGAKPIRQIVNPALAAHWPALVAQATAVAGRLVSNATANAEARRRFAGRYLTHTLRNLPRIAAGADVGALFGLLAGRPAVVVGAGPSLDDNLPALAAVADRAVIIAADTALRPLLAAGIRPHLVVAVDPAELNARHIAGLDPADAVHLVAEGSLHPSTFDAFAGRTFFFKVSDHEPWPWLRAAGCDRQLLLTWGSVVTSAFDLARRAGCNPILFSGLDLAFTHDRPYCRHTIFDRMWLDAMAYHGCTWQHVFDDYFSRVSIEWARDLADRRVRTTPHLLAFRGWLVEQMTADSTRRYINGTGAGLLFGGPIEQRPLSEALAGVPLPAEPADVLIGRAHRGSAVPVPPVCDAARTLHDGIDSPHAAALLARWVAFTADSLGVEDIREALRQALDGGVAGRPVMSDPRPPVSAGRHHPA
jgi:hypothetical protein